MQRLRTTAVDNRLTNLETTTEATTAQLQALTAAVLQLSGEVTRVNANLQTLTAEIQQIRLNPIPNPNPHLQQNKNPPPVNPIMDSNSKIGIGSPSIYRQENVNLTGVNSDEDEEAGGLFAEDDHINLKVIGLDGKGLTYFKMKRSAQLKSLMVEYCEKNAISACYGVRFICRGRRLSGEETPNDYGMEDGDHIVVVLQLRGN